MTQRTLVQDPPRRRQAGEGTVAGWILAFISLGTVVAVRAARRRRKAAADAGTAEPPAASQALIAGAEDVNHRLAIIRGYCEMAKMKGESGEALARRMDAAISTVAEITALLQQLIAASRRRRSGSWDL